MDHRDDAARLDDPPHMLDGESRARRAGDEDRAAGPGVTKDVRGLVDRVVAFATERPLAAIGIAFGVGFVLGGGLFNRFVARAFGAGMRLGGTALARRWIANAIDARTARHPA